VTVAELQDRLRKIEAIVPGAASSGEREAAGAAIHQGDALGRVFQLSKVLDASLLQISQTIIRREIHEDTVEPEEEKPLPGR